MAKNIMDFWKKAGADITDTSSILDTDEILDTTEVLDNGEVLGIKDDEADDVQNINLTYEERRAWGLRNSIDKTKNLIEAFEKKLNTVKSKAEANVIITEGGIELFNTATLKIKTDWNWRDNYLYWTRLIFRVLMKKSKNKIIKSTIIELINLLEDYSRGRETVNFKTQIKNVIISGFELFDVQKGNELTQANQSGILALSLHGTIIPIENGEVNIQSVIWSNRYEDFNSNIIEDFYSKYFNEADLIITFSLDASDKNTINIERYAANYRGGGFDNNHTSVSAKKTILSEKVFYETTLPFIPMVKNNLSFKGFKTFLREGYEGISKKGEKLGDFYMQLQNANPESLKTNIKIEDFDTMTSGSGGDYFSNEIFFRVARMRDKIQPDFPYGHIHVPAVSEEKYEDFISLITKIIKDAF